jgi:hypothetical protein
MPAMLTVSLAGIISTVSEEVESEFGYGYHMTARLAGCLSADFSLGLQLEVFSLARSRL